MLAPMIRLAGLARLLLPVLVLAAAVHRQSALEATTCLIDWLKTRAPFWKKEQYADGKQLWVDASEEDETKAARWGGQPA